MTTSERQHLRATTGYTMIVGETPTEFSKRLARLQQQARLAYPDGPDFVEAIDEAMLGGATYREALERLVLRASGGAD